MSILRTNETDDAAGISGNDAMQTLLIVDTERSRFTTKKYLVVFLPGCDCLPLYLGLAKHDIRKLEVGSTIE